MLDSVSLGVTVSGSVMAAGQGVEQVPSPGRIDGENVGATWEVAPRTG
ncbi:MAG: hypothetical protein KDA61_14610 [Planctomycetales bacterium]|nr:hypothetical protein [Planctomycetales bacterium]